MYQIKWDRENNGVELKYSLENGLKTKPRPVFHQELDILGFNKYWKYPKSDNPLLWAVERKYYYKGIEVAIAKGGNIYEAPEIILTPEGENLILQPINLDILIKKNRKALFVLENEALDFIEKTFKAYNPSIKTLRNSILNNEVKIKRGRIDLFAVSFSGGKDSQVILDLVSRVIPPEYYKVVYSDTDMELPSSIEIFEESKKIYQNKYPELEFYIEKNETSTEDYWKEFGPPSRIHRWCCTVIKTVPFNRLLNKIYKGNGVPKIMVFDGIRKAESAKRATYDRITKGAKHLMVTNASPILNWNITEVWLYLLARQLPINESYKKGLTRVGCAVCPFSTGWSEFFIRKAYPKLSEKYFNIIDEVVEKQGIKDKNTYIKKGNWKKRAGGKGLFAKEEVRVDFLEQKPDFKSTLRNPQENLLEWLKVVGDIIYDNNNNKGEIKIKKDFYNFTIKNEEGKQSIQIKNIEQNPSLISKIKRVLYKTTYCAHCEACQIECPTGALTILPEVKVNADLCTHCSNCLTFTDKGCLVAKSKHISEKNITMKKNRKKSINRYSTFGLREKWLKSFLENYQNWFEKDNQLGTEQVPAMANWLRDAELLKLKEKKPTELTEILEKNFDINQIWQIILNNLYYNSLIIKWFFDEIKWNSKLNKKDLLPILESTYPESSPRTLNNALQSLINTFEKTNSEFMLDLISIVKEGRNKIIFKKGTNNIDLSSLLYSLYKYAENNNRYNFTVSELFSDDINGGAYKIYGLSKTSLENKLRSLQELSNGLVNVAIIADLDTIDLRKEFTAIEALRIFINKE